MKLSVLRGNRVSFFVAFLLVVVSHVVVAQSLCTITGTSPLEWANPGPSCLEGGNAGDHTILKVPSGFTLNLANGDTWTGTGIVVDGVLNINADVTLNCSVLVRTGGVLNLNAKLFLGSSAGCGYGIGAQNGGTINVGGTGSDRLTVCGEEMMKGNGSCNSCGGTNSGQCAYNGDPYCEPAAGFTGPTGYGEGGYSSVLLPELETVLPIQLSYFTAEIDEDQIVIKWATEKEENFDHFEVQRAGTDLKFASIIKVPGAGYNTNSLKEYSTYDNNPLVGTGYYKLKAVDIDGSFEYFNIVAVTYKGGKNFYVSPNPSSGSSIKYNINFDPSTSDRIVLVDAVGNELATQSVTGSVNELTPAKTLLPGVYLLRYVSSDYQQVVRVFVK